MTSVLISLLAMLRSVVRSRAAQHLEALALRHQLQVLQRSRSRRLRLAKTIVERLADAARDREAPDGPRQASYIWGNPIWPFMPTSSFGCFVFDTLIAIWFLAGAPTPVMARSEALH